MPCFITNILSIITNISLQYVGGRKRGGRRESWRKGAPQGRGRAEVSGLEIKGNH